MLPILYARYKKPFWALLAFLFGSGVVSKLLRGSPAWEVGLNGGAALVCLAVCLMHVYRSRSRSKQDE